MRTIVDGNNVMGSRPDGWWRDRVGAAARLISEIGAQERSRGWLIVFDGRGEDGEMDGVEVRYAGPESADDLIARLAEKGEAERVYTSDRGLRERIEKVGVAVLGARRALDGAGSRRSVNGGD